MICKPVGEYPGFHNIEIIAELEAPVKRGAVLSAVKENVDEICNENAGRFKRFVPESSYRPNLVLIKKLSESLMAVSFYGNAWQTYGLKHPGELDQLQYVIGALGGQLTVLQPHADSALNIGAHDLNLHFYFDPMDLFGWRFRTYPKNLVGGDTEAGEENDIRELANYIIDKFYSTALALMDIRPGQAVVHTQLRYA